MVRAPSRPVACRASLLPQQYCVGLLCSLPVCCNAAEPPQQAAEGQSVSV